MGICISKKKSLRQFRFTANSTAGKASGRTTIYHRGGGKRRLFRVIDYYRYFWNVPGLVVRFDYNPVSNMVLALISYVNGVLCYIACPKGLHVGDFIQNLTFYEPGRPGIANYLKTIPVGTFVHHLELKQFLGSQYLRAYGAYGRVMSRDANLVYIKLRSSKIIGVPV